MHHSSESQSVTRPLLGMNRNRTAEPQRAPKIYICTPEDASTRWSQRQADTFKQQAMKLISERRRNVRRTFSFFCIVLNWVIFFFFITSQTFLWNISSRHLNSISEKRMFMFQNSKNIFFIFILFSFFFFTCETEWKQISERKLYFYIVLYLKQEHFFFDNDIFFQENFLKWIKNQVNFYLSMWNWVKTERQETNFS